MTALYRQSGTAGLQQLTARRLQLGAERMGIALNGDCLQIPFFDQIFHITPIDKKWPRR